jgi:hypothetical protein
MGQCTSTPEGLEFIAEPYEVGPSGGAGRSSPRDTGSSCDGTATVHARGDGDGDGCGGAEPSGDDGCDNNISSRVGSMTLGRPRSATKSALHLQFLTEITGLQQQMALVSDNALMALQEAAELLATQLGADLIA